MLRLMVTGIFLFSASLAFSSESSVRVIRVANSVADRIVSESDALTDAQKTQILEHYGKIINILDGQKEPLCELPREVYKEAYIFAKEKMGKSNFNAEQFAETVSVKPCANFYLGVFKVFYAFAETEMQKSAYNSEQISFEISSFEEKAQYSRAIVDCFIEDFRFAVKDMGKSRYNAEQYARQQCLK